jgi:hypothetical protein
MFLFVICFNCLLTLLNLYLVFRLIQLRGVLARVTRTLTYVERRIHRIFYPAPDYILMGGQGTQRLRAYYQILGLQLASLQPILILISLGIRFWHRQGKRRLATR